jgi:large conductance mechanosensitive channel
MLSDFRAFLLKTNALALAIAVIIGAALGTVVTSLVEDIIMPPIGLLLGGVDFAELALPLNADGSVAIRYGEFINAVITFIVIAFVVWQISKAFIRDEPEAELRDCPFCREKVALEATRCRACTSDLTVAPQVSAGRS